MTRSEMDTRASTSYPQIEGRFVPGQVLAGRFLVVRYIARGGMGEVYEVEDCFLQKVHVALKVIAPEIAQDSTSASRFKQEVLLARKVVHPNLCPLYDIAYCDDPAPPFLFFTMKFVAGETLSARLSRPERIAREDATSIFRQLVSGIAAIHAAGVIHRDIKPNNVMLDSSGSELCVSIMDFGLARLHDAEATMATQSIMAGTPGYMAPEVLRGQGPSQASDLFALGVLIHQVFTGEAPRFKPLSLVAEASPKLDKAGVPAILIQSVKELLASEPERRCKAFEQLKAALSIGSSGTHLAVAGGHGVARTTPVTRRQFAIGSAAAAGALAAGVAWKRDWLYDRMHPLPPKRFVALIGWPFPADPRVEPAITSVVSAIASELTRAEATDHNLFIIPHHVGKDIESMSQINEMRESLGANLVLSAAGTVAGDQLHLLLRVLDPVASKIIRERSIATPIDDQLSLPDKAVRAAADLLNVAKMDNDFERVKGGTDNAEAFAAFQKAEGLRAQENDEGLPSSIEAYKKAIDSDPRYALAKAKLALAYFRSYVLHRDPAALILARSNCEAALAVSPKLVEGHLALASVLSWTGDESGALREISKALSIDPHNPAALLQQGQELTRCNRWIDAEASFLRLQAARTNLWLGYEELGIVYSEDGKFAKAADQFRAANLASPKRTLPLVNLSTISLQTGNLEDALDYAEKSLKLAANDHAAAAMAAALRCQGKHDEALTFALQAVALGPEYSDNWIELGDCYSLVAGQALKSESAFARAAKLQLQAVQVNAADGPVWMSLALAQAKIGRLDSSASSLQTADHNFTNDLDSQLIKVRTLALLRRPAEAAATASACIARGATSFQFLYMPDINGLREQLKF